MRPNSLITETQRKTYYLLIGPLKLFLLLQVTVHIFKYSAFRNPFVPTGKTICPISYLKLYCQVLKISVKNLLFIPPAVMYKIFDLFILDVYLNTLQKEMVYYQRRSKDNLTQTLSHAAYLSFVEQWPMKTQHSFT